MKFKSKESLKKHLNENGIVPRGSWFAAMETNNGWKHVDVCGKSFGQSKKEVLDLISGVERVVLDRGDVWHELHVLKA